MTPDQDDSYSLLGSRDDKLGTPPGDHDEPFAQGRAEKTVRNFPVRQWAKLLGVRSSREATDRRVMESQKSHEIER